MIEIPSARKAVLEPEGFDASWNPKSQNGKNRYSGSCSFVGITDVRYISGESCRASLISPVSGFSRGVVTGLPPPQLQYLLISSLPHLAQISRLKTRASHSCAASCSSMISWCSTSNFPSLFCTCASPSRSNKSAKCDHLLEFSRPTETLDSTAPGICRVTKGLAVDVCGLWLIAKKGRKQQGL